MESIVIAVYQGIIALIYLYSILWFVWIVLGWLNNFGILSVDFYHPAIRLLQKITDGVIDRVFGNFRERLVLGAIDFAPLVFLFILSYILPQVLGYLVAILLRNIR
jgi:YggT family protein